MARPKTLRKPSKERLARSFRKQAMREAKRRPISSWVSPSNDFVSVTAGGAGGAGGVTWTTTTATSTLSSAAGANFCPASGMTDYSAGPNGTTVTYPTGTTITLPQVTSAGRLVFPERQVTIESLDEGLTWHDRVNMTPAVNRDGRLIYYTNDYGQAPEHMRPGSGNYTFTFMVRGATGAEAETWAADYAAREQFRAVSAEASRKASVRARELLLSHLRESQRRDYETKKGFWVTSQFRNKYWVTRSTAVRFDHEGRALQRYCIHSVDYNIPGEDNALMRMLVLECNEDLFLSTANPGQPSEWDIETRHQTLDDMWSAGTEATLRTEAQQDAAAPQPDASGNVRWVQQFTPSMPVLIFANGVVRPLTG